MGKVEQIDTLYKLKKEVEKSQNTVLVSQINEVIKKVYESKKVISFVGHFSSGKSSMINHLLNEEILPSSPVPTTSNAAQITINDTEEIIVNLEGQQYAVVNSYDEVKQLNTENKMIESVEIRHQNKNFDIGLTLQDTPGIDATFKNHAANTMKYLLTSDILVYTVEYNHVESEKNFEEMKKLNEIGVPLIFVINQIDKHDEKEIRFIDFKISIENNLAMWQINVEKMYFTSIYEHDLNEVSQLKETLFNTSLLSHSRDQFFERITNYIVSQQEQFLLNKKEQLLAEFDIEAQQFNQYKAEVLNAITLKNEQSIFSSAENVEQFFVTEVRDILKNAYIIPFELREQIKVLLEVYQPDYKVGGLFGRAKKHQQMKEEQINKVRLELNELIDKQINFHIRALFMQYAKFTSPEWVSENQKYTYEVNNEEIERLMQQQTSITADYVLHYADQLKKYIEGAVVREIKAIVAKFYASVDISTLELTSTTVQMDAIEDYEYTLGLIESLTTENYRHYYIHIDNSIDQLIDRTKISLQLSTETETKESIVANQNKEIVSVDNSKQILEKYRAIDYFSATTSRLLEQLDRIENGLTKIVVFGAFSAGKSALINALLGKEVLVSSPNPTTAAITELSYGKTHRLKFKTEQMMLNELNKIGRTVQIEAQTITEWLQLYNKTRPELEHQFKKYVQALIENYEVYEQQLQTGAIVEIKTNEIDQFASVDSHSAFVDRLYLQFELPFLKDKVIIDSPGIGSTNMRHTNETTEIIADSDLLVYVSYFNHVFTENDRKFITYLNELQVLSGDSETFFVVNAIDLAKNEAEVAQVKSYFESELSQLNVTGNIYSLSSRHYNDSPFDHFFNTFKTALNQFSEEGSKQQKIIQLNRGVELMVEHSKSIVNDFMKAKEKEEQDKSFYNDVLNKPIFSLSQVDYSITESKNLLEEQLVFLKDKFKIQLYDLIKVYFNRRVISQYSEYKEAVSRKLEEELTMVIPRMNYAYMNALLEQTAIGRTKLMQHNIVTTIESQVLIPITTEIVQPDISLSNYKVSQKTYFKETTLNTLYETIHEDTMQSVQKKLKDYKEAVNNYIEQHFKELNLQWVAYNEQVNNDIQIQLSKQLNNEIIEQLKEILKEVN